MSGPFEITAPSNTVTLDEQRQGIASFTIKNISRRHLRASARIVPTPASQPASTFTILGPGGEVLKPETLRDFNVDESTQYQVKITPPADAPPGSYNFKLVLAEELNPDDNFTESTDVVYTVPEQQQEKPKPKLPAWVIPVVVIVVLVVVIGIIAAVVITNNQKNADATATTVAEGSTATIVIGSTATAQAVATQTASVLQTLAAQNATVAVQQTATTQAIQTQTAINQAMAPYLGDWVEVNGANVPTLNVAKVNNSTVSFTITYCAPPDANFCLVGGSSNWGTKNVAFAPPSLTTVFGAATLVTVQPASSNRLGLTITPSGSIASSYVMKPKCANVFLCNVIIFPLVDVNTNFRPQAAPTATPG